MSRIAAHFEALKARGRKALIPYITAGDPEPGNTVPLMHEMVAAGADIIELGVPFSDPMADGPVIQQACERALKHRVSLRKVLEMVREFRRDNIETPVVLMGYLNPVEIMGYETLADEAARAGVDGVLTVDLPPEESAELAGALKRHGVDPIFLLAPTSHEARIRSVSEVAAGFVYYVSLKGVTGAATLDVDAVAQKLAPIRRQTDLPVGVGFGISDAEAAAKVSRIADAVVVGSALVKRIAAHADDPAAGRREVAQVLAGMRRAMDQATTATPA
ncbi:tryptophan synthase subunit alpha [Ectothiorhodospira sp. PHS-1]|uniref:tryptophan synthase subunit alpha n=1 Tax=Ectothiorhodospira sp. PHS-1 TaxID=519989 RepID=UPI00024A82AB|nr:tryptophan synthase subunit alpha [Ectothiorhodospira sp. PHS-1]EHQ53276.1 tryptophan synthase subunit alpha [Ectothiorhodospira sp. PHS-1]